MKTKVDDDACAQSAGYGMGTVITHRLFGRRAEAALRACEKEVARLEALLSRFIPGSDIDMINSSAGSGCVRVRDETFEVLSRSVEFSRCCQGCFDVTIGPLVDLWSGAKTRSRPPVENDIRAVLPLINYADLILEPGAKTAGLARPGQSIDLGGIGKGFAADRILRVCKEYGVTSAFTNFGGNVAATGAKPDGSPWRVGIRHPRDENALAGVVDVTDGSVVTSGDYQRYFTDIGGKRRHHLLDPATGYPSESGLISATVIAESSVEADALSTVLFVAGKDKGLEILKSFPGIEAVLIDSNMSAYATAGLKGRFQAAAGMKEVYFQH